MRIRTTLNLAAVLATTLAAGVLAAFMTLHEDLRRVRDWETASAELLRAIFELNLISYDYLLDRGERARLQWQGAYQALKERLDEEGRLMEAGADDSTLDHLQRAYRQAGDLFAELERLAAEPQAGTPGEIWPRELRERLATRLSLAALDMYLDAHRLAAEARTANATHQQRLDRMVYILVALVLGYAAAAAVYVRRRILCPLARLQTDIALIGSGRLDHRVRVTGADELGELSAAFNRMTENLQRSTASVEELNREVAERQAAQTRSREAEQRYRALFEDAPDGILVLDADTLQPVEFNDVACRLLGYDRQRFAGLPLTGHLVAGQAALEFLYRARVGGSATGQVELRTQGGEVLRTLISTRPMTLAGRPVLHTILRDVTETLRQQARLAQSEKLAAVGVMTAGIAHELNNPLMGVLNFTEYALRHLDPESKVHAVLRDSREAVDRVIRTVHSLLAVVRPEDRSLTDLTPQRLGDALDKVLSLLDHRIQREGVTVNRSLDGDLPPVRISPDHVQQILLNLLVNAMDAVQDTAVKVIQVRADTMTGALALTVADSGHGVDPGIQGRILEPFFTTKDVGQGTGLGLWIVHNIARQYGGEVKMQSPPGQGAAFTVVLPCPGAVTLERPHEQIRAGDR